MLKVENKKINLKKRKNTIKRMLNKLDIKIK